MFCPNCGKSNQKIDTYCRQCGEFVLNPSSKLFPLSVLFGSEGNPEKQINFSILLSFATVVVSGLLIGFLLGYYEAHFERTGESAPKIIYAVYAFLGLIGFWQLLSIFVGLQMKSKFKRRKNADDESFSDLSTANLSSAETRELLPEADTANMIDPSVTENTTRNLVKEKRN